MNQRGRASGFHPDPIGVARFNLPEINFLPFFFHFHSSGSYRQGAEAYFYMVCRLRGLK